MWRNLLRIATATLLIACATISPRAEAALSILHDFSSADGQAPNALTFGSEGALYGTTFEGGAYPKCDQGGYVGCGALYSLILNGPFKTLTSFDVRNGSFPPSAVIEGGDRAFYGVTQNGGRLKPCLRGCGTVFKYNRTTGLSTLWTLDGKKAANPSSPLLPAGNSTFYGVTYSGGDTSCNGGCGTIFSITRTGSPQILANFTRPVGSGPAGQLALDKAGNIFGTTYYGGPAKAGRCPGGCGTIFRFTPGQIPVPLYAFTGGKDGANPRGGLAAGPDGNFYGVTQGGGQANNGTVFKITPDGAFTTIAVFANRNGSVPTGRVAVDPNGDVYGTTFYGGSVLLGGGRGLLFRASPDGIVTPLEYFNYKNGSGPQDVILAPNGILYGVTQSGGAHGDGVVFALDPKSGDPDAFDFGQRTGVAHKANIASAEIALSGFGVPAPISITGGQYRTATLGLAWSAWTAAPGTLNPGQAVQVLVQSAATTKTVTTATLTVGAVTGAFSVQQFSF